MPDIAETIKIAVQHHQAGRLARAEELYQSILKNNPDHPDVLHSLGVLAAQKDQNHLAVELIERAIASNSQAPRFYNTLGLVCEQLGKFDEAVNAYQQATRLAPDFAEAFHNMAVALQAQKRFDDAIESCKKAISIKPDYAWAYNTIGYCLDMQNKDDQAIENYSKAIEIAPDYAEAYNHLGTIHAAHNRYDQAIENYRQAIRIDPDYAEAHWNLALLLLVAGRFEEGFKEYQWRLSGDLKILTYPHHHEQPRWDGRPFVGKRLLVHYEQGFGDTIHFVRYMPMVKARGGTVILEVRKPLYNLLTGFTGVDEIVEASFDNKPQINFDLHVSLLDLPQIFETTTDNITDVVPYIFADPDKAQFWQEMLSGPDFKVGIVWSGSPVYERNHLRACRLADFAPLAAIDGIKLFALQKGTPADQIADLAGKVPVVNLGEQFEDFTDTAAAIENLDLIISTDTSVPHLAAAMGKPVWLLLCCASDWRWLLDRSDSPWYPTMKLFRQTKANCWDDVFISVTEQLQIVLNQQTVGAK